MPQRSAPYTGRRTAPASHSAPSRRKVSRPAPSAASGRQQRPNAPGARRRMAQLLISAVLLLAVVAVKLLFPATLERCRATLLELMGADTDFVEVFAAAGRAFSGDSTLSDALSDAYTAVFNPTQVEVQTTAAVSRTGDIPDNVELLQCVLDFDYTDPVADGQLSSLFGARDDPLEEGQARFHYGIDIAGEEGTVIRAFAGGTVTAVGESSDLGRYVTISHDNGFSTLYAHCLKITASSGQTVRPGDPVAEMGSTGRATGAHLHFELLRDNTYLNPIYYVQTS